MKSLSWVYALPILLYSYHSARKKQLKFYHGADGDEGGQDEVPLTKDHEAPLSLPLLPRRRALALSPPPTLPRARAPSLLSSPVETPRERSRRLRSLDLSAPDATPRVARKSQPAPSHGAHTKLEKSIAYPHPNRPSRAYFELYKRHAPPNDALVMMRQLDEYDEANKALTKSGGASDQAAVDAEGQSAGETEMV